MFSLKCRRFVGSVAFLCVFLPVLGQENTWVKLNDFIGGKRVKLGDNFFSLDKFDRFDRRYSLNRSNYNPIHGL